jgi:hypothetical protein
MTKSNLKMIDTSTHQLTAAQVLVEVIRTFQRDTTCGVIIAAPKGRGDQMVAQIRVELSRAKKEHERMKKPFRHFGFTSQNLDMTIENGGVRMEYRLLEYRVTPLQAMKNYAMQLEAPAT